MNQQENKNQLYTTSTNIKFSDYQYIKKKYKTIRNYIEQSLKIMRQND